jgi:uncharacterized protein (TIGR01777 family)
MHIFLTGGTGLIGRRLTRTLRARGDHVLLLTRRGAAAAPAFGAGTASLGREGRIFVTFPASEPGPDVELVAGDPMQPGPWQERLTTCDAAINLAGEGLFNKRWNAAFKQLLIDSRLQSTTNVATALARQPTRSDGTPKVLVNASGIAWYGYHGDEELDESQPPTETFLARLCVDWEKATQPAVAAGVRVALVRIGMVLDKEGGALRELLTPFKLCVGGPVGLGRHYTSWIHHADLIGLFLLALDNPAATGPLNATAPNPVTSAAFARALGRALHRPAWLPAPPLALRLLFGEVASVVTKGQRVLPRKALALGYAFRYPTLEEALRQILA